MRVTIKDLQILVDQLNQITGHDAGNNRTSVGTYVISGAYGGHKLDQIVSDSGGVRHITRTGYTTKRDLYYQISAYMDGVTAGREAVKS